MGSTNSSRKRVWCISITAVVVLILIAVVTPTAVVLRKRHHQDEAKVLLPLYIYPESNDTWAPLYDV